MTYHVHMIHPKLGDRGPILNGITNRPASWPTYDAAALYVQDCRINTPWSSSRDDFAWDYEIKEHKGASE